VRFYGERPSAAFLWSVVTHPAFLPDRSVTGGAGLPSMRRQRPVPQNAKAARERPTSTQAPVLSDFVVWSGPTTNVTISRVVPPIRVPLIWL
jgi:hypothetical protein